jgi:multiple sugar transport system ATP-binding protein
MFVAGFIGSPAMNLFEATLEQDRESLVVQIGAIRLVVPSETAASRPSLAGHVGREVVVGIRPKDLEDATLAPASDPDTTIDATVELAEALGSDVVVHFTLDARQALTDDVKELAADAGHVDLVERRAERGRANVVARLNPRTRARRGDPIRLVVDTARLHFFDPDSGIAIY